MTTEYLYQSEKILKNDVVLALKLPLKLRDAFSTLCESKGITAAGFEHHRSDSQSMRAHSGRDRGTSRALCWRLASGTNDRRALTSELKRLAPELCIVLLTRPTTMDALRRIVQFGIDGLGLHPVPEFICSI
ncbi:hypothetical protein SAMN04515620_15018 [Collimonas sp. OK607]|uniref:hypothetical protein n=1 Tax=Collimonas sp. OK607 TaxID=1798194 RepID=UPI0008F21BD3|nr:hypothetical protein [Collimonas sp. OK607]SFB35863.1 hypothetical protein SAMN04515620_15018 [Collimonas sp. OK607]